MRRLTSLTAAAAVVVTSIGFAATPAEARSKHRGWGHRHHDRISTGDVIGGLLIIGTIAAIAGSANKDRRDRRDRDDRYEPPYREDRRTMQDYQPRPGDREVMPYGQGEAEARAADACSWAVEAEMGDDARVENVTGTQPSDGGWYVTGTASLGDGELRSFGCSVRNGRVVDVRFG